MVIEYARNVVGLEGASSSEFEPDSKYPVIATMEEQLDIVDGKGDLGGTMRLGLYEANSTKAPLLPKPTAPRTSANVTGTATRSTTSTASRCRQGLTFSGTSPDGKLVEFVELPRDVHPYYVATQAHPELSSRPTRPHPLFAGLIKAALAHQHAADAVPAASVSAGTGAAASAKAEAPAAAAKPSSAAVSK